MEYTRINSLEGSCIFECTECPCRYLFVIYSLCFKFLKEIYTETNTLFTNISDQRFYSIAVYIIGYYVLVLKNWVYET